jgi:hypothetical protein
VSSYAIDDGARLLLFDPLALPVEVMLPAYGAPTDHAALERALS